MQAPTRISSGYIHSAIPSHRENIHWSPSPLNERRTQRLQSRLITHHLRHKENDGFESCCFPKIHLAFTVSSPAQNLSMSVAVTTTMAPTVASTMAAAVASYRNRKAGSNSSRDQFKELPRLENPSWWLRSTRAFILRLKRSQRFPCVFYFDHSFSSIWQISLLFIDLSVRCNVHNSAKRIAHHQLVLL